MKINKEALYALYIEWVDQVTEECDWKTSFGPEEIVNAIAHILETNPHLYEKKNIIKIDLRGCKNWKECEKVIELITSGKVKITVDKL
jgi:hypothetical protein